MNARIIAIAIAIAFAGCDGKSKPSAEPTEPTPPPVAAVDATAADPAPEPGPPAEPTEPAPPPIDGKNFIDDLKFLYRATACGGSGPVEAPISQKAIDLHCKKLAVDVKKWRERWQARAYPFFKELVPADISKTVVYPFAGADLLSVLAVFPDFKEATTLSLEPSGDPRRVRTMKASHFRGALNGVRAQLHNLLVMNHNLTLKMITHFRGGGLPGHLIFTLKALELNGLEPRAAYYFTVKPDGGLDYLTEAEIAAFPDKESIAKRNARFGSIEVHFAKPGDSNVRIYRHILANLDDKHLADDPAALAHLKAKGKVAMMTKAASYLLWYGTFSTIRAYMLEHMTWLVSDSTGIPPSDAEPAGFELITYGRFTGPILKPPRRVGAELRKLWRSQPRRKLDFRFGYPDAANLHHMMVTRPKAP